jgi:hypothetical protein
MFRVSRAGDGTPGLFGKRHAPLPKYPDTTYIQPATAKAGLPDPIHDVQPSFCFMGLGHEHVTFPHVHDVHDVQELDGMDRVD